MTSCRRFELSTSVALVLLACCCVSAQQPAAVASSCDLELANNATRAHQRLVGLAQLVDPSGKLSKLVADFHPEPAAAASGGHEHKHSHKAVHETDEPLGVDASEIVETKRAAETTTAAAPTTEAAVAATANATEKSDGSASAPSTTAPAAPVAGETPTPGPSATVNTSTASNVTVNVFLVQLAPDAKTEELINNPDLTSTTTSSTNAAGVSTSTTAAPSPNSTETAGQASSAAPTSSSTTETVAAAAATTEAPASTTTTPSQAPKSSRRRRRRWASAGAPATAPAAAPAPPAPLATAAPVAAAPAEQTTQSSSTAATPTRAPTTVATQQAPSSSGTTSSTTTRTSTTTTTTTTAAPTTARAAVEQSPKDVSKALVDYMAQSHLKSTAAAPVEIVVNSATGPAPGAAAAPDAAVQAQAPAAQPAPSGAPAPAATITVAAAAPPSAATTTTTTTTTPALSTSHAPAAAAPVEIVTSSATEPAPAASTTVAAAAPSSTTTTTTSQKPASSGQSPAKAVASSSQVAAPSGHNAGRHEQQQAEHSSNELPAAAEPVQTDQRTITTSRLELSAHLAPANTTSLLDFPIDNLNVIYDNDTAIRGLAYDELVANANKGQLLPVASGSNQTNGRDEDLAPQQNNKHINNSIAVQPAPGGGQFVNLDGVDGEETFKDQDTFAACQLVGATNASSLVGRLGFWQPKENRGASHLVARFRYRTNSSVVTAAHKRKRRESFTVPIERELPLNQQRPGAQTASEPKQATNQLIRHRIWLVTNTNASDNILLAELKTPVVPAPDTQTGTVDVDAELVLGKNVHLSGDKSIVGKSLILTLATAKDESPWSRLADCTILGSNSIVDELDHLPSVSVVQPIREDLLLGKR